MLITSIGETHAEFTLACIAAGKPVLCEKPLAPTTAECEQVLDAEVALRQAARHRRLHAPLRPRLPAGQGVARERRRSAMPLILHNVHRNATVARVVHELHDDDRLDDPRGRHHAAGCWARRSPPSRSSRRSGRRRRSRTSRTRSSRSSRPSPGSCPRSSSSPTASTATTSAASSWAPTGTASLVNPVVAGQVTTGDRRQSGAAQLARSVRRRLHGRAAGLDQRARSAARPSEPAPGKATRRRGSSRSASRRSARGERVAIDYIEKPALYR